MENDAIVGSTSSTQIRPRLVLNASPPTSPSSLSVTTRELPGAPVCGFGLIVNSTPPSGSRPAAGVLASFACFLMISEARWLLVNVQVIESPGSTFSSAFRLARSPVLVVPCVSVQATVVRSQPNTAPSVTDFGPKSGYEMVNSLL